MPAWVLVTLGIAMVLADLLIAGGASVILLVVAGGFFGAAIASALGGDVTAQLVGAAAGVVVAIPIVLALSRFVTRARGQALQDGRLEGSHHQVVEDRGEACLRIHGDRFPARFADSGKPPEIGQRVEIVRFEGITAIVREVSSA